MADPICTECEFPLKAVGSFYACQNAACDRYALPCFKTLGDYGHTDAEHEAARDTQRDHDATGVSR